LLLIQAGFFTSAAGSLWGIIAGRLNPYLIVTDVRMSYFLLLWESFAAHPLLGLGAGNFALWGAAMTGSALVHSAHGFFWAALADFGLLGLGALVAVFVVVIYRLCRTLRRTPRQSLPYAVLVGLLAALLANVGNSMFGGDRPTFHLLFIAGLAVGYSSCIQAETGGRE
jgi:O-antigen ligase